MTTTARDARAAGSDMTRRVASGLALATLVFASIATVWTFAAVLLFVCLASLWELAGLTERKGQPLNVPVAAVAVSCYLVLTARGVQHAYGTALLVVTVVSALAFSLGGDRQGYFARSAFTVFGVLYIGWLGSYFLVLRNQPHFGAAYLAESIVAIAFTDIFAMLVGSRFGKHPLTSISPRKTWEGAIGGFVATTLVCGAFGLVPALGIAWWQGLVVGALTSVAAQIGDIVESAFKRDAHVKDAGRMMAGHGGILDRYDSYTLGGIAFYAGLYVTGHIVHS